MKKFLSFLMLFVLCFSATLALAEIPEGYVSVYSLKPEADITPLTIGAKSSYQLAGPANGWGDLADYDFSKYRKLVINLTFDPADAGKIFAVRFNVNSTVGNAKVKLEKFTLPESGTSFSAEIDLEKYAEDGKVGVGGIVFYNGAAHWSFNYDEGTPTALPVTINYVALADEIIDPTIIPKDYVSFYTIKAESEKSPLEVGAVASYQLAGPAAGWGDLADYDLSKYNKLVINLTFDPADAGKMFAVRFNVNSTPGNALVKLEKFTLPATGTNFSAVIDLQKYAEDGKVGVGGIILYNGAAHWSFNYDDGTPTSLPVTINYVAVGPVEEVPVKLTTDLVVENIVVGTVDSPDDFTGNLSISWDLEKVYMIFDITDDSIVASGTAYQVDNIEVYFDMDNSKNIHWPRNGGWISNDATYDANDFQLRLVPGVDFSVNNTFGGAVQEYEVTEKGYLFKLTIPWDSLMEGFVPAVGTQIGFDVLVSDNDAVASDANRNQITLVSKTDKPFNDPSLFGTLEFLAEGMFKLIYDTTAPAKPVVTATVDASSVTLSWPLASDNIAVMSYDVKQDGVLIKEDIYAAEAGNSLKINNLADGTYKFTVVCYDNSGNSSMTDVSVDIITVSVDEMMVGFKAYPNPTNGIVNIVSGSNAASVLDVYNLTGVRILSKSFVNNCTINLSNIHKGIYILSVTTDSKVNISKLDLK